MKIEQEHIDAIRFGFENMQTKEDLLHLLNQAKTFVYGENAVSFELKQLTWYSNPKLNKNRYRQFVIQKKSGSKRIINAPNLGLKAIQKTLNFVLQCVFEPHTAATGFVRNKSIVDNAKLHEGSMYVYNIDLKDFFPSIDQARVWKVLQLYPFNLNLEKSIQPKYYGIAEFKKEYFGTERKIEMYRSRKTGWWVSNPTEDITIFGSSSIDLKGQLFIEKRVDAFHSKKVKKSKWVYNLVNEKKVHNRTQIANLIAGLCCTDLEVERLSELTGEWEKEIRSVLPQGAPTSPVLSNMVCQKLDFLLAAVAKRFGLNYSRYADDITFSSMHNVYQDGSDFLKELHRIITQQKFHIKDSKTRLQKEGYRKEVTGLLVNEKVNVQKRYIKELRMWLYYWERYGYNKASVIFEQNYLSKKYDAFKSKPKIENVILGKLDYLKMVKGESNPLFVNLKKRFDLLCGMTDFDLLFDLWEAKGVDYVMGLYKIGNSKKKYE